MIGKGARLGRVCVKSCDDVGQDIPTLFIGGDSTVRDYEGCYPYNPLTNGGSWGQNLLQYMDKMAVCNQAHSGLTTNCFREDGHWELVKANLRPDERAESSQAEERPNLSHELAELPYVDCRTLPEKEAEVLKKAMAYGLLDPCVRHLHPHEEMPRAQFVFLLLKVVKPARRRPWQGEYCDLSRYEFDAEQIQMALDEGLIDPATTPGKRFRPDDAITLGELVSFAVRGAKARGERDLGMEECFGEAEKWGWIGDEGEDRGRRVTRGECVGVVVRVWERVSLYALQAVQ